MHVLIALSTNCKNHGPRILMTTEPIRDTNDIHPQGFQNSAITREADSQTVYGDGELPYICSKDRHRCYHCAEISYPIKSNDHLTRTSYITTAMPIKKHLYENLFVACHCLYKETLTPVKKKENNVPEDPHLELWKKVKDGEKRESAVIHKIPELGYVLFYQFHVFIPFVDFSFRNYSILVVSKDLSHLTQHYDYFIGECKELSTALQNVHPPLNQIKKEHRKVLIGPQNLCDEFTLLVHRSFVKMLHMPQHSIREKLMSGKLSENNQKLLELDTPTTEMIVGDVEYADEVRKLTLCRLKSLATNFKEEDFKLFIRHIVGGGQVIIQAHATLAEQFVLAIAQLLPYGCVKPKMCANTYYPEYKTLFNIVCMLFNSKIPNDPEIMMIRVNEYSKSPMIPFYKSSFTMALRPEIPEYQGPMPIVATRYVDLLQDEIVTGGILEKALDTTKEGWLEKAKIFHFMKNNTSLNDMEVIRKIRGCDQKDLKVIKFWTNGLSEVFKQGLGKDQEINHVEYAFEQLRIQNYESKAKLQIKIKSKPAPVPTPPPIAESVLPGDIETQPSAKIVFNAPFDEEHICQLKLKNLSKNRIGFGIKATKRLGVEPTFGVLNSKEAVFIAVSCFDYKQEGTHSDNVTIKWVNVPDGEADKKFHEEWFQDDGIVRRKQIPIEYNS